MLGADIGGCLCFCGSPWTEELLHRSKLTNSPRVDDDAMRVSLRQPSGSLRGGACLIELIWLLKCLSGLTYHQKTYHEDSEYLALRRIRKGNLQL